MKFWDSSALVPLLVGQPTTRAMQAIAARDMEMLVWWASEVECASALARLERDKQLDTRSSALAHQRLKQLTDAWSIIEAGDVVRETAIRFLRVHSLRAADALQLAAAFVAAERRPPTLEFVSLDGRLLEAARREGFEVVTVGRA